MKWLLSLLLELSAALWPTVTRTSPKRCELPDGVRQVHRRRNAGGCFAVYHPESHYRPLHLVESGIVLTLAALATTTARSVLRRRAGWDRRSRTSLPRGEGRTCRHLRRRTGNRPA
ncbi:hypothetical protein ACIPSA_14955 [Streptomyces sp. NPDC086549]|uniref:hypothetical protein n=1 Tax=Streptomyces sp. NPDC086549 TaxID=3365752 RepID=UPI003812C881